MIFFYSFKSVRRFLTDVMRNWKALLLRSKLLFFFGNYWWGPGAHLKEIVVGRIKIFIYAVYVVTSE